MITVPGAARHPLIAKGLLMNTAKFSAIALSVAMLGFTNMVRAQEAQKLFLDGDIVRGNTALGATGPICVLNSQFKRGENVVFRVRVRTVAGQLLDDKGIKGITVELTDGRKLQARYGGHPPRTPTDFFWTAAWMIPESFPTGTLGYKVTAADMQGNTQTWEPMREYRSWVVIIPGTVEYKKDAPQ
jgi:hypothetical protein